MCVLKPTMEIAPGKSHLARRSKFKTDLILDISPAEHFAGYDDIYIDTIKTDYGTVKIRLPFIDITPVGDPTNNRLRFEKALPAHMTPDHTQLFNIPGHLNGSVDPGDFMTCVVNGLDKDAAVRGWVCFYAEDVASLVIAQQYEAYDHVIEFPVSEVYTL